MVIGGNHDSPDRIQAADPLAVMHGISLVGYPNAVSYTHLDVYKRQEYYSASRNEHTVREIDPYHLRLSLIHI